MPHSVSSNTNQSNVQSSGVVYLQGDIGFANLPNWYMQAAKRDGLHYNLIVVGAAGRGKSTLINSMFDAEVLPPDRNRYPIKAGQIEFVEYNKEVAEAGVKVALSVTEVLGFGEIGQSKDRQKIVQAVESRLREHFDIEQQAKARTAKKDKLFHAALFFLTCNSHDGVSQQDIQLIKEVQRRVHVIPIVSKADMLMPHEYEALKLQIRDVFKREGVADFPSILDVNDEEHVLRDAHEIRSRFPLFTVAGHTAVEKSVRSRHYPWGAINLEKDDWNDLFYVQKLLVRSFLAFLRKATVSNVYEQFRAELTGQKQSIASAVESVATPQSSTSIPTAALNASADLITPTDLDGDNKKPKKSGKKKSKPTEADEAKPEEIALA